MKSIKVLNAIVMYIFLYAITYTLHVLYFSVDVIFYAALFDTIIAAIAMGIILNVSYFSLFNNLDRLLIIVIAILLGYAISISIPTVIDRSLSFYILEKIDQRGGGVLLSSIEDIIKDEYIKEHRLADVRLTEQLKSGTIAIEDGCIKLTDSGRLIVKFSNFFRKNLLPKKRLLMGTYTDVLTNPFKDGLSKVNYRCN
jgi:hypothetical protein